MRSRIDQKTLEEQLPAVLHEQFQLDGLPRDHEPSWEYITAHTRYSAEGLNNKSKELYGQTLLEFLREQGFGVRNTGKWPTNDEETIQSLEYYVNSAQDRRGWSEKTIDSVRSVMNKVYEAIREEGLGIELLDLGVYNSEKERVENIQHTITIIEYMDRNLADSTMGNYPFYFEEYYNIVKNRYPINLNPVTEALDEFEWYRSENEPQPVTEAQLKALWNTLNAIRDCPVRDYDLDQWRLWMKVLLVFLIAVGPRSSEVEKLDVRTQLHFGDDPYVQFDERKNLRRNEGPDKVPIMTGARLLELYVDYIESTGGNGKLIPSPQSSSGSRRASTLNNWLEELCKIADIRLDDGSFPTIQNFRQFWKTLYKRALHENRDQIKFVSEEGGTKTPGVDEKNYLDNVENRNHVRELGRQYFGDVLDLDEIPAELRAELDQESQLDGQSKIQDYDTHA
ncbi:hypothetical protein [Halovivax cerinus]|uniref:Tyr recombinase domain-containing protein n=1 Tax=Halovivax cerinus TaxID=1487865 RepID=A0ABD5NKM5_9EURY|nr:hypothetical protein [Halovivax cerinus]